MAVPLTDFDLMPFGAHKGTAMQDVPSRYLDWLIGQHWISEWPRVKAYIEVNLDDIQKDIDDN